MGRQFALVTKFNARTVITRLRIEWGTRSGTASTMIQGMSQVARLAANNLNEK